MDKRKVIKNIKQIFFLFSFYLKIFFFLILEKSKHTNIVFYVIRFFVILIILFIISIFCFFIIKFKLVEIYRIAIGLNCYQIFILFFAGLLYFCVYYFLEKVYSKPVGREFSRNNSSVETEKEKSIVEQLEESNFTEFSFRTKGLENNLVTYYNIVQAYLILLEPGKEDLFLEDYKIAKEKMLSNLVELYFLLQMDSVPRCYNIVYYYACFLEKNIIEKKNTREQYPYILTLKYCLVILDILEEKKANKDKMPYEFHKFGEKFLYLF